MFVSPGMECLPLLRRYFLPEDGHAPLCLRMEPMVSRVEELMLIRDVLFMSSSCKAYRSFFPRVYARASEGRVASITTAVQGWLRVFSSLLVGFRFCVVVGVYDLIGFVFRRDLL